MKCCIKWYVDVDNTYKLRPQSRWNNRYYSKTRDFENMGFKFAQMSAIRTWFRKNEWREERCCTRDTKRINAVKNSFKWKRQRRNKNKLMFFIDPAASNTHPQNILSIACGWFFWILLMYMTKGTNENISRRFAIKFSFTNKKTSWYRVYFKKIRKRWKC